MCCNRHPEPSTLRTSGNSTSNHQGSYRNLPQNSEHFIQKISNVTAKIELEHGKFSKVRVGYLGVSRAYIRGSAFGEKHALKHFEVESSKLESMPPWFWERFLSCAVLSGLLCRPSWHGQHFQRSQWFVFLQVCVPPTWKRFTSVSGSRKATFTRRPNLFELQMPHFDLSRGCGSK